jgi:mannose-6-phosphate isomerase-like protein (cupin superfamily)
MKLVRGADHTYTPASHEDPRSPGSLKKVLLARDDLAEGRVQMVNWSLLPAGKGFNLHYHDTLQEIFIMIRGTADVMVGEQRFAIGPGDALRVDEGEIHRMIAREEDVEYVVFGITRDSSGKTVVVQNSSGR